MTLPEAGSELVAPRTSRLVPLLAAVYPLAFYVAGAAQDVGPGDEGAYVAAAVNLTPISAPGTPLAAIAGGFATLLPAGPLAFRVSLASALCAAAVLGFFAHATELTLRGLWGARSRHAAGWSLLAAWGLAQAPAFCAQALRPQAFMTQTLVALATIVALLRFERAEPAGDKRMLYAAMFLHGLAFANHHVLALLLLGASAPTLGRLFARRGFMGVMGHAAASVVGFSAYAFVPIRLNGGPEPLAERSVLVRSIAFLDHEPFAVSADVTRTPFAHALELGLVGPRPWFGFALVCAALVACARYLPRSGPRRFVFLWCLVFALPAFGSVLVLPALPERDHFGVLVPCVMAVYVLAVIGIGSLVSVLARRAAASTRTARHAERVVIAAAALVAGVRIAQASAHELAQRDHLTDALDELARRDLPRDAALLTDDPDTFFHHLGAEAEEALRPDETLVPLFVGAPPKWLEAQLVRDAGLRDVVAAHGAGGAHELAALHALASGREVMLDVAARPSPWLCPLLVPHGLFARVLAESPSPLERGLADAAQRTRLEALWQDLAQAGVQPASRRVARAEFAHGLCAAVRGDLPAARAALAIGLLYAPGYTPLAYLQNAVDHGVPVDAQALLRAIALEQAQ